MTEPRIVQLDAGPFKNGYDRGSETIVIDMALEDYPLAREYVLEHERGHHEMDGGILATLRYEFEHDCFLWLSDDDTAREARRYARTEGPALKDVYAKMAVDGPRMCWMMLLQPLGRLLDLWRWVR